jgi:uncharacterized OB-fold protein
VSKRTERKSLDYVKKKYVRTRTLSGNWYLTSYNFKFNISHMKPFLDNLKQKKLIGLKCPGCNRVFFPPRLVCGNCLIKPNQWVDLRETGQVSTFAIAYLKDPESGEIKEKPMVLIQQDGSDTSYMAELSPDIDFKDTYIGMPVRIHWVDKPHGGLDDIDYYEPIDDNAKDLELRKD